MTSIHSTKSRRIWLTGDMTLGGIGRQLKKVIGDEWDVDVADFNAWSTDVLNPQSRMRISDPGLVVVILSPRFLTENPLAESQLQLFLNGIKTYIGKCQFFITNFVADPIIPQSLTQTHQQNKASSKLNQILFDFQASHSSFYILDQSAFFVEHGISKLHDPRYEVIARTFFSPSSEILVAKWISRHIKAVVKPSKKVLVLDLDQTLWGGILGEDGIDGIKLSNDNGGYPFLRFHKSLLDLKHSGVLLAICSKNDDSHACKVFQTHPDCILKLNDFVARRINWFSKAENIRSIAQELGLGLDSFVFADDSKFECEQVKQMIPEVDILELPSDPAEYVKALSLYEGFDKLRITEEDRLRSEMVQSDHSRKQLQKDSATLEDFYKSLEMRGEIIPVDERSLDRVYQLLHKTNQFNLTTRRHTLQELNAMLAMPNMFEIYALRLTDKLGENGITGVMIVKKTSEQWEIDSFLLSCRIIGRTVEFAWIQWIVQRAQKVGMKSIIADFIPTSRNQVASEFLAQAGFKKEQDRWQLSLDAKNIMPKTYVNLSEVIHG